MGNIATQAGKRPARHFNEKQPAHRILVVEDEPDIRRLNSEILIGSGYHVDAAADGAAAWEALQLKDYHLLITDNEMPKVSGADLLKKLHAARMALPVIMATGTLSHDEFTQHPEIQPAAVLLKPYTVVELLGTVKNVLHTTSDARKQA
jgi:two-component system alkaline phosphatase synthesis response regulator PhoP